MNLLEIDTNLDGNKWTKFREELIEKGPKSFFASCAMTIRDGFQEAQNEPIEIVSKIIADTSTMGNITEFYMITAINAIKVLSKTENWNFSEPAKIDWYALAQTIANSQTIENGKFPIPINAALDILLEIYQAGREHDAGSLNNAMQRSTRGAQSYVAVINNAGANPGGGDVLHLSMDLIEPGEGWLYPHPAERFFNIMDENEDGTERFIDALDNAAKACGLCAWHPQIKCENRRASAPNFDIRWSMKEMGAGEGILALQGNSAGGAMYTLCRALMMEAGKELPPEMEGAQTAGER